MSLLMQALKKAEQAKRSQSGVEDDLVKPSEEFDDVLELAPQEPIPQNRRATDPVTLDVPAGTNGFSLEPLDPAPVTHDATIPELEVPSWNEPQDPSDIPDALHTSVPPAASVPPAEGAPTANARKPVPPQAQAAREARAEAARQRSRTGAPPPAPPPRPVAAAPMRAPNPRTMRLAALLGVLILIAGTFGFLYWRAVYGPGSSKNLPPVPMPGMAGSAAVPVQPESGAMVVAPGTQPVYVPAAGSEAQAYPPPGQVQGAATAPAGLAQAPAAPPEQAPAAAPVAFPSNIGAAPTPPPVQAQPPMQGAPATAGGAAAQNVPSPTAAQMQGLSPEDYARMDRQAASAADAAAATANSAQAGGAVTITPTAPATVAQAPAAPAGPGIAPVASMPPTTSGNAPVQVQQHTTSGEVSPALQSAYAALRQGDIEVAREQYNTLLQAEPRNRDVLLGAAAIALRDRQPERAAEIYARLLDGDPNDPDALAGLLSIRQADPIQTEARLRRIINLDPEAVSALSALGHLYARQGRWSEAQQQYFKAYAVAPQSADNAFNLAVGLDRVNQPKLALTYYQRALALSATGSPTFNANAVANRIRELGGR